MGPGPEIPSNQTGAPRPLANFTSPSSQPRLPTPAGSTPNLTLSNPTNTINPANSNACQKLPITPNTWNQLGIDNYLQSYPGGANISLTAFAKANGAANFGCGEGENCNAGQLCHPVQAPAWQVLYAVQEWNHNTNMLMDAVAYSMGMVQSTSAAMVNDLFPQEHNSRFVLDLTWLYTTVIGAASLGAAVTAGTVIAAAAASAIASLSLTSALSFMFLNVPILVAQGAMIATFFQDPVSTPGFAEWTQLSFYLARMQDVFQRNCAENTQKMMDAGISTDLGIFGAIKNGNFFFPTALLEMSKIEEQIGKIVKARLVNKILRQQGAFVTIGSDPCHGSGPNGSRAGNDRLSYCDKDGLMYNVVRAEGKKTKNDIYNAIMIRDKYGFTAEEITTISVQCQNKYGNFEHDPLVDPQARLTGNMDCGFNLPVCNCKDEAVAGKRSNGKTTVVACREGLGLPI